MFQGWIETKELTGPHF